MADLKPLIGDSWWLTGLALTGGVLLLQYQTMKAIDPQHRDPGGVLTRTMLSTMDYPHRPTPPSTEHGQRHTSRRDFNYDNSEHPAVTDLNVDAIAQLGKCGREYYAHNMAQKSALEDHA
jgi:hypothetical protein